MPDVPTVLQPETVPIAALRPHPENYRKHPPEQIRHLAASIQENGVYRNLVVAEDLTILAGHGVEIACREAGLEEILVVKLPIHPDDPRALKIVTGDNEIPLLADDNSRQLAEILRTIRDSDAGLLGTGYDDASLANLLMTTRPSSEIADKETAAHWVGMPDFVPGPDEVQLIMNFLSVEDRDRFVDQYEIVLRHGRNGKQSWTAFWPPRPFADNVSLKYDDEPASVA